MNCPNCGRELAEGEVCNCMTNEVFPNAAPIGEPEIIEAAPEAAAFTMPQPQQAPVYTAAPQPQGSYAPPVYGTVPNAAYQQPVYGDPNAAYQQPYYTPAVELPARTDYPEGYKIKRKYVAVLLGATLGTLGIHNFYLGNQSKAIAQLLLSTVGSLILVGPIAAAVWSLVETVQILTESIDKDANGFKIQTFEEALVKTRMEAERKLKEEENQ